MLPLADGGTANGCSLLFTGTRDPHDRERTEKAGARRPAGSPFGTEPGNDNTAAAPDVKVLNQTGTELPSTGGIGTTIFYVLGSVLVVAAGVLLVTKKRMDGKA